MDFGRLGILGIRFLILEIRVLILGIRVLIILFTFLGLGFSEGVNFGAKQSRFCCICAFMCIFFCCYWVSGFEYEEEEARTTIFLGSV